MKKKLLLFLLFTSLTGISQTLYPYLQNVTPNSIYVSWKTDIIP